MSWRLRSNSLSALTMGMILCLTLMTSASLRAEEVTGAQEFRAEMDKWMLQAYEGDRDAQFKVGILFTNSQFAAPDYEQAVYWYKQAARQGHVLAQYNLGHQYLIGQGVQRNETSAMNWWLKAAAQDHPLAAFNVGRAYYLGIGLDKDHTQSRYWFERAARNKEPKSIEILEQLGWAQPGQYTKAAAVDDIITPPVNSAAAANTALPATEPATIEKPQIPEKEPAVSRQADREQQEQSDAPITETQIAKTTVKAEPEQQESQIQTEANVQTDGEQQDQTSPAPTSQTASATSNAAPSEPSAGAAEPSDPPLEQISVGVYTNPATRSVLITIFDSIDGIEVVSKGDEWTRVRSKTGLPVWVHQNFIRPKGNLGEVTGEGVNARSVPLITEGTIVGRLNKAETVALIDQQGDWYRLLSPARFEAWVKTDVLQQALVSSESEVISARTTANTSRSATQSQAAGSVKRKQGWQTFTDQNDNDWLFSQPQDNYTLQLASFDDPAKVAEFVSRPKFINNPNLRRFTATNQDIRWTYFLYGSFNSPEAANKEREKIGQRLGWVRSFGRLQQNRCLAWKKQIPAPKALNKYCT